MAWNEPCPKNEGKSHLFPIGNWECVFCGTEQPGEEFYFGDIMNNGKNSGKFFINKDGCRKVGEIPEDVKRRNAAEYAKLVGMYESD